MTVPISTSYVWCCWWLCFLTVLYFLAVFSPHFWFYPDVLSLRSWLCKFPTWKMCDGEFGLRDLLMLESDQTHYRMICITFHSFMLFLLLLCAVGAHASAMVPCRGQRTMCGKNSFFFFHSPRSFQGSNLDPQAWQWAPLPADPSVHPLGSDAFWVNWLMDQAAGSPVTWWNIIFESVWGRDMILWPNRRLILPV